MSDERLSDECLLASLDCAWSAQCGACLNVVNDEVPKLLSENAMLTAQLAARDAEVARLREHVLDAVDCLDRVMGPRNDEIRLAMDALRAALAAPTSGDAVTT